MAYLVQKILEKCTGTEDLATHLVFIDSLDEQSKRAISSTIFMNKLAVSLCNILLLYGGTIPSPFRGGFQYFHHDGFPDLLKSTLETCLNKLAICTILVVLYWFVITAQIPTYQEWERTLFKSSEIMTGIGNCNCHPCSQILVEAVIDSFLPIANMVFQRHSNSDGSFCITVRSDLWV